MSPERVSGFDALSTAKGKAAARKAGPMGDQADTSRLSQLMSKSARQLGEMTRPRADKIAAYRATLDEPVEASPAVVTTILKRMLNG
jgi:hypothetical protein